MNVEALKESIIEYLELKDLGKAGANPLMNYYECDSQGTDGEKASYIGHMYENLLEQLNGESSALAESKAEVSKKLALVNKNYQIELEDSMHIDSIFKKIHELKRLHVHTQTEAQAMFPETTPELLHLNTLERKGEELQANVDHVEKEASNVQKSLDNSRQKLDEKIRNYEEKKSQEEHKLELLVVIQNVVRKKREQIVERNASLIQLKKEIEDFKTQIEYNERQILLTSAQVERIKLDVQEPRDHLLRLESIKSSLHKEMSTIDREIDAKKREDEESDRMRNEAISKLRKRLEGFRDKKQMYEEKARVRLKLQNLLKELEAVGIKLDVEDKVKSLLK